MSKPLQSACATPEQIAGLDEIVEMLKVSRGDLVQPSASSYDLRTTVSQPEGRRLCEIAFRLDTHAASIIRGLVRAFLRNYDNPEPGG